jgi:formylglycine-generating enzyme required for sulfatase activity
VCWKDAVAYCKWAGKRLCVAIVGGSNPFDQFANASSSEWYAACSSGGVHIYAFGDKPSPSTCNDFENPATGCSGVGTCERLPVGSLAGCQSPEPAWSGVFDMSGNVWEWEDSCDGTGSGSLCRIRGGSFGEGMDNLRCDPDASPPRVNTGYLLGFRCCAP